MRQAYARLRQYALQAVQKTLLIVQNVSKTLYEHSFWTISACPVVLPTTKKSCTVQKVCLRRVHVA